MTHFNAFKPHPSAHNPMDFNTLHLPLFSFTVSASLYIIVCLSLTTLQPYKHHLVPIYILTSNLKPEIISNITVSSELTKNVLTISEKMRPSNLINAFGYSLSRLLIFLNSSITFSSSSALIVLTSSFSLVIANIQHCSNVNFSKKYI